ncbi:hypothetical protein [Nocardia caishijiensis]|nr:hypothetical protein [Nocardia caishijiensis]
MRKARMWAAATAASPIVFPLLVSVAAAVVAMVAGPGADVAWYLVFTLILGMATFVPGLCATLLGLALLPRRSGIVVTVVGLLLVMGASGLMAVGIFDDALSSLDGSPRLIPKLSVQGAIAASLPYAAVVIVGLYAIFVAVAAARATGSQPLVSRTSATFPAAE